MSPESDLCAVTKQEAHPCKSDGSLPWTFPWGMLALPGDKNPHCSQVSSRGFPQDSINILGAQVRHVFGSKIFSSRLAWQAVLNTSVASVFDCKIGFWLALVKFLFIW